MVLLKIKGDIVGHSVVQDYVFCPIKYNSVSLYDWIHLSHIEKHPKQKIQDLYDDINKIEMPDIGDINIPILLMKAKMLYFIPF